MSVPKIVGKTNYLLSILSLLYPQYSKDFLFSAILCGEVQVNEFVERNHNRLIKKGSRILLPDLDKKVKKEFVSRGGNKLEPVLDYLEVKVADKIWLDCGSATGGFTQCLLGRGATKVHAVDVGYNILDYSLRVNPQVIVHERTNILQVNSFDPDVHCSVADMSFRSLRGVVGHIVSLCLQGYLLALCKPQFEYIAHIKHYPEYTTLNREFNGVLEDKEVVRHVLFVLLCDLLDEGVFVSNLLPAGITGRRGNQEYFFEISKTKALNDTYHTSYGIFSVKEVRKRYERYVVSI